MTQFRRVVPPALEALFATLQPLDVADLYTVTLTGGQVIRWTDSDAPVTLAGTTWALGPGLERDQLEFRAGVDTQSAEFTVTDDGRTLVNGQPLLPFLMRGGFDGAAIVIDQVYAPLRGAWVDKLERFTGRCGPVKTKGKLEVGILVNSITELFDRPLPPDVFDPQCRNELYDPVCAVSRDEFTVAGTASGPSSGLRLVVPHTLPQAAGHFDLGTIKFMTGANAGVRRTVRQHTSGEIRLMQPLPGVVVAGDSFEILPGCDLKRSTCIAKFDNLGRFRGFPFVPPPETVL